MSYHLPYRISHVTKESAGDGWRMGCRRDSPLDEIAWSGEWYPTGPEYVCGTNTLEAHMIDQFPFRQPGRVFWNPSNAGEMWVTTFGGGVWIGQES